MRTHILPLVLVTAALLSACERTRTREEYLASGNEAQNNAEPISADRSRTRASTAAKSGTWLAWQASAFSLRSIVSEMSTTTCGFSHCIR